MEIVVLGSQAGPARPRSVGCLGRNALAVALVAASAAAVPAHAQLPAPGAAVEELLAIARERTPELAVMRLEAEAVAERAGPAGAFPDPMFRVELQDIEKG